MIEIIPKIGNEEIQSICTNLAMEIVDTELYKKDNLFIANCMVVICSLRKFGIKNYLPGIKFKHKNTAFFFSIFDDFPNGETIHDYDKYKHKYFEFNSLKFRVDYRIMDEGEEI